MDIAESDSFRTPQPGIDPQEQVIAAQVIERWRSAKRDRMEIANKWRIFFDFFLGKQRSREKEGWAADIVINYCFGMIESMLPLMTDGRPKIQLLPTEPGDEDKVEDFELLFDFYWNKEELDKQIERLVLFGLITGTGIGKVFWNQQREQGMGDVCVEVLSPYYFFIDPAAQDIGDAKWVIHAEPRTLGWIAEKYGVQVEQDFETEGPDDKSLDKIGVTFTDGYDSADTSRVDEGHTVQDIGWLKDLQTGGYVPGKVKKAVVLELWERVMMPQQVPTGQMNPDGSPATIEIPMPVIQRTTVLGLKGKRVLPPEPQPPSISMFPFFSFVSYNRPHSFWGIGDIENLISLQKEYNKRKQQVIEAFALTASGRMLLPIECDVDPDSITNEPGEVIPYVETGGHKPSLMFPIQIPNAFFKHQEEIKKDIEAVAGIYDVTQGRTPKGIQAASAIANLQEAAQSRVRLKARHLDESIRQLARILLEHFITFYKATRWIRIIGDNGMPMIKPFQIQQYLADRSTIKFDIISESGLTMKMTHDEKEKRAMELFQAGIIDDIAVLDQIAFPKKDQIIERKYGAVGQILSDKNLQFLLPVLQQRAQELLVQVQEMLASQESPRAAGQSAPAPPPAGNGGT